MLPSLSPGILLVALSVLLTVETKAQSLSWAQAINGCSTGAFGTTAGASATDDAGNLYTTGSFCGTVDFNAGLGVDTLSAVSKADLFIMKQDPSGNLIWVRQVKGLSVGVNGCGGRPLLDGNGNVLVIGIFRDSFDFDPGLPFTSLIPTGAIMHSF